MLKVHFNIKGEVQLNALLADNNGKVMIQQTQACGNAEQEMAIDLSGYAPGIYNLNLKAGDWQKSLKVVK